MKLPTVSGDILVKLALAGVALLAVAYVVRAVRDIGGQALNEAGQVLHEVNPLNENNVIYQTVNKATGGDESRPLGTRIYNYFHPEENL